ncbi:MAG: oligopeptide ABC transporter ATP-binding protein, partial [Thermoprotei archaeon]
CDRLAIMYLGKIVELGPTEKVVDEPMHPYARALISAVPDPDPSVRIGEIPIKGRVPSPISLPSGCRFWPRCIYADEECKRKEPEMVEVEKGRWVACHKIR